MQPASRVNNTGLLREANQRTHVSRKKITLFVQHLSLEKEIRGEQVCKGIMFINSPAFDALRVEFHTITCRGSRSIPLSSVTTSLPLESAGTLWISLYTRWKKSYKMKTKIYHRSFLFCHILFFILIQYPSLWLSSTEEMKKKALEVRMFLPVITYRFICLPTGRRDTISQR